MPRNDLVGEMLAGSRRALARLLTRVENEPEQATALLAEVFPPSGQAWIIGITGAPGTGKSSLVSAITREYRQRERSVAVLAVDPSSPFTGGAILGDRIRMQDHAGDPGVFIRSMATRGSLGGLALATRDAVRLLDAAGFDLILVETVGAGQSEVEIARTAYTTLVIEAPGLGDDVQAIKAGILEIADILVVNKADRVGAHQTMRSLKAMLELGHPSLRNQFSAHHGRMMVSSTPSVQEQEHLWIPPVVQTVAIEGKGVPELVDSIEAHRDWVTQSGRGLRLQAQALEMELLERLEATMMERVLARLPEDILHQMVQRVLEQRQDPQTVVEAVLSSLNGFRSS